MYLSLRTFYYHREPYIPCHSEPIFTVILSVAKNLVQLRVTIRRLSLQALFYCYGGRSAAIPYKENSKSQIRNTKQYEMFQI